MDVFDGLEPNLLKAACHGAPFATGLASTA